jgi:hypothetical protein
MIHFHKNKKKIKLSLCRVQAICVVYGITVQRIQGKRESLVSKHLVMYIHCRFKKIEFQKLRLLSSIPRPIAQANVSIRLLLTTQPSVKYLYFDKELNQYPSILGGVLQLSLYEMPVILKRYRGWSVRPHYPSYNMPRLSYPLANSVVDSAVDEDELSQQSWPFSIEFPLPEECSPPAKECYEARLWNPTQSTWLTEGIGSFDYDTGMNYCDVLIA